MHPPSPPSLSSSFPLPLPSLSPHPPTSPPLGFFPSPSLPLLLSPIPGSHVLPSPLLFPMCLVKLLRQQEKKNLLWNSAIYLPTVGGGCFAKVLNFENGLVHLATDIVSWYLKCFPVVRGDWRVAKAWFKPSVPFGCLPIFLVFFSWTQFLLCVISNPHPVFYAVGPGRHCFSI